MQTSRSNSDCVFGLTRWRLGLLEWKLWYCGPSASYNTEYCRNDSLECVEITLLSLGFMASACLYWIVISFHCWCSYVCTSCFMNSVSVAHWKSCNRNHFYFLNLENWLSWTASLCQLTHVHELLYALWLDVWPITPYLVCFGHFLSLWSVSVPRLYRYFTSIGCCQVPCTPLCKLIVRSLLVVLLSQQF